MKGITTVSLRDTATINPRLHEELEAFQVVAFVPMAALSAEFAAITKEESRKYSEVSKGYTSFLDGDILVAKITPCFENGKIAQANLSKKIGFGSTEFHVVRPNPGSLDGRYLHHFLRQDFIRINGERRMTGSGGQRRIPGNYLADLKLPLPPLHEQRRIAEILDKAEALRFKRRAALAKLDTLAQSIFLDMFGDPATNPKRWPCIEFSQLLKTIESGWSPNCQDRPVQEGEWGVLKLGAITKCEYNPKENKALPVGIQCDPTIEVRSGDLLFTRKNTYELVAACALVRETPPRLMMSDLIFRLRLNDDAPIDPVYLHRLLTNPSKRSEIQKMASGAAGSMPNISKARLQAAQIELPPLPLQQAFARRIEAIEALKERHRASLTKLDALFACLQHRAFRGEL